MGTPRRYPQRWAELALGASLVWSFSVEVVSAQSTNGTTTLLEETFSSGGGRVGGGNPMTAVTMLGQPAAGVGANDAFTIVVGYPADAPDLPSGTNAITVEGTLSEPVDSVVVKSEPLGEVVAATIEGMTFRAINVPLTEGQNTLTATAIDRVGLSASYTITVYLDTRPPARPTLAATPPVTTATSYTLTGTKTPGTSVWVNGVEVVPLNDDATWTTTIPLVEGDNVLVIVTKDAAGNESTSTAVTIVVDNLPPVISEVTFVDPDGQVLRLDSSTQSPKTNFSPVTVRGRVDDSLTTVQINGRPEAPQPKRTFEVTLPLSGGATALTLIATSPNDHVTTETFTVTRGTTPILLSAQPADATKHPVGTTLAIQATASDMEADPLEYQILIGGVVVADWSATAPYPWTLRESDLGLRPLDLRVRDGFGGLASIQAEVYILHPAVPPPVVSQPTQVQTLTLLQTPSKSTVGKATVKPTPKTSKRPKPIPKRTVTPKSSKKK
ncbi:MAG: hypothetical protein Q8R91_02575 [Candidatus Omnitrophota bacterium]|nr:hypothetical protein [Candidatus Omnitrophota bacterium]